jgi:hypothetical protein
MTDALRGRKKAVTFVGAAAALLGAGTASAAALSTAAHAPSAPAAVTRTATAHQAASAQLSPVSQKAISAAVASAGQAVKRAAAAELAPAGLAPVKSAAPVAPVKNVAAAESASPLVPVSHAAAAESASPLAPVTNAATVKTTAPVTKAAPVKSAAPAATTAPAPAAAVGGTAKPAAPQAESWSQIQQTVARQTNPSEPAAVNQLQPVGTAGPQAWMPISPAQQANATTIVQQALARGMGVRSAVIAVATSMQESQLQNLSYGDSDSLGLFQQRPSMGWGTAQQILTPQFAADAFLTALAQQQASTPGWVHQPLWTTAQSVQKSGFPVAYAKWETQAVQLVRQIVTQVK